MSSSNIGPSQAKPHQLNPMGRFSDRAGDYKRHRPSYPAGAIDAVLDGLRDPARLIAADIGAGTGISSRLLAERGVHVIAIEPNAEMRRAGENEPPAAGAAPIRWVDAAAEATTLDVSSVDLIVCAQAFHWFDPDCALREFHRILKPRARAALVWNDGDRSDAATEMYYAAFDRVSTENVRKSMHPTHTAFRDSRLFSGYRVVEVPNSHRHDLDGLIGRAFSASYAPKQGPGRDELTRLMTELHRAHAAADGQVTLRYITSVHLAERA